ncbi:MAG: C-methyltransferase [Actinomycetia bacterium]|nr:C-methyltransferase [Actinomycetes bacterium]
MSPVTCRGCGAELVDVFCDLGVSPLANSYVDVADARRMEPFYPLKVLVCRSCLLVQVEELATASDIFSEYAYFSSASTSWLDHARRFAGDAVGALGLGAGSLVVELASNDGYLLRWFVEAGIPVLGVEPAANVAAAAEAVGVPSRVAFFGEALGRALAADRRADLVVANNVLAHVPDLHDFVAGIAELLAPEGVASIEFPHLLRLMADVQYDTIYHEHFSYFSIHSLTPVLAAHGLVIADVVELPTHGGSLRLSVRHAAVAGPSARVDEVLAAEQAAGLHELATYLAFGAQVDAAKRTTLRTLIELREQGLRIAGYGAPAKGNTLLNHCGIGTDFVSFTVDANPVKQGTLLPGSRIPVLAPDVLRDERPDVVWLLPWNLRDELLEQLAHIRDWGGRFLVLQPRPELLP